MSSAIFELAILLSLKDAASNRLDSFGDKLRARGKDARYALEEFESLRRGIGRVGSQVARFGPGSSRHPKREIGDDRHGPPRRVHVRRDSR